MENPTLLEIFLLVGQGTNFASAIAKKLEKKQPTVTEQLKMLESIGLVKPLERGKAQRYAVDWGPIVESFYSVADEALRSRNRYDGGEFLSRVETAGLSRLFPAEFIQRFLQEYISVLLDIGGKRKGLRELVFAFFRGIVDLDKNEWRGLVRKYDLNSRLAQDVAYGVAIENSVVEQTALGSSAMLD